MPLYEDEDEEERDAIEKLKYRTNFEKKLDDIKGHVLTKDENKKFEKFKAIFDINRDINSKDDYEKKLRLLENLLPIYEHETSFSKKLEELEREEYSSEYELTVNDRVQEPGKYVTERGSIYGEELPRHASANYNKPKNAKQVRILTLDRGGKRKKPTKRRRPTKRRKHTKKRKPTKKRRAGKSS